MANIAKGPSRWLILVLPGVVLTTLAVGAYWNPQGLLPEDISIGFFTEFASAAIVFFLIGLLVSWRASKAEAAVSKIALPRIGKLSSLAVETVAGLDIPSSDIHHLMSKWKKNGDSELAGPVFNAIHSGLIGTQLPKELKDVTERAEKVLSLFSAILDVGVVSVIASVNARAEALHNYLDRPGTGDLYARNLVSEFLELHKAHEELKRIVDQ